MQKFTRMLVACSAILFSIQAFSQDITDTRKKTESFKRLQPANIRSEVASFTFGGITESAQAPALQKISPTILSRDSLVIAGDGIYAKVSLASFNPKGHKIQYDDEAEKIPIRIDRKTYYGDYGKMPVTSVQSIILTINGDTVHIPQEAYSDLMNMKFSYLNSGAERTNDGIFISKDHKRIYLYLFSKGNTSSYEVTFIIQDKSYLKRVLDYDLL